MANFLSDGARFEASGKPVLIQHEDGSVFSAWSSSALVIGCYDLKENKAKGFQAQDPGAGNRRNLSEVVPSLRLRIVRIGSGRKVLPFFIVALPLLYFPAVAFLSCLCSFSLPYLVLFMALVLCIGDFIY